MPDAATVPRKRSIELRIKKISLLLVSRFLINAGT